MNYAATTAEMKELDRMAIQERGIPSLELMEDAAREAAQAGVDLVGPVKEPRRPDGVIGSAVSVAFVMREDSREPTPEELEQMDSTEGETDEGMEKLGEVYYDAETGKYYIIENGN